MYFNNAAQPFLKISTRPDITGQAALIKHYIYFRNKAI